MRFKRVPALKFSRMLLFTSMIILATTYNPGQVLGIHLPNPIVLNGWTVYWELTADDGLAVQNVTYNGVMVLKDARLAGVVVKYLSGLCFFYDEVGTDPPDPYTATIAHADVSLIVYPAPGGFNLTGDASVPGYDYKQTWAFYPDGRFMALLKVGGGGCNDIHTYEARWRFDMALEGDGSDTVYQYTGDGWSSIRTETNTTDTGARDSVNHYTAWSVTDKTFTYYIAPFDRPLATASPPKLLAVASRQGEIENSHQPGSVTPYIYVNEERVYRSNLALWYISEHTHDIHQEVVFEEPVLTGLIFYPKGF